MPALAGPVDVNLAWEKQTGTNNGITCTDRGNNPCKGTFPAVHRIFSGSEARSGPIVEAHVRDANAPSLDAHSLEMCSSGCTHDLVVELKLVGSLEDAQSVNDPPVALRVIGGSQNHRSTATRRNRI